MVFPTFGSSVKGGNKDAAFHTLTLVRLKGVGQGGLAMMSDLDMSGNKLMNAQAIDTANLTSSNGVINVINADMNIENNELRVKRFKTDELASKTGGAIDIRSNVRLANSDAQPPLPKADSIADPPVIALEDDNGEWDNWNDLEARDITCRTLNYTEINPSISGVIKNVYTAKNQEAKSLKSFYVNDKANYTIAGVTGTDGKKLNLILASSTDLSSATGLTTSKYVYNITARLNHLPDDHLAYFFVARNGNVNLEDMYVKGVKDTLVTLSGTTGDGVTEIKLYGAYSYSPNTNIEVAGQNTTSEKYVTVSDVVLTAFECMDITDKTTTPPTTYTLTVTVQGLVTNNYVFVRLNGNEITQQLVEGDTGDADRTVKFTIGTGSAYSITAFIPHNINVEIDTGASSILTGTANANVNNIVLTFKQNFLLTVSVTGVVVGETMKLNLDGLLNTYNETISNFSPTSFINIGGANGNTPPALWTSDPTTYLSSGAEAADIKTDVQIDATTGEYTLTNTTWGTPPGNDSKDNAVYIIPAAVLGPTNTVNLTITLSKWDTDATPTFTVTGSAIPLPATSQLFPQITTADNYKLSVLADDTGFINYQISESTKADGASTVTVDPESFNISGTSTVNLTVIRLYKISVTVPTLTNGPLKVKLDYTGEVLTFTTGGTQSFPVGVPTGVKINIYSVESPNYVGIRMDHTVLADNYSFTGITLTTLYSVSIIGTNLTSNEVKLTLKTNADVAADITENYYNVRCSSTYGNAFDLTKSPGNGIKYNDVNTTIVLNGTPTQVPVQGQYTITGTDLVFYYIPGVKVYIISGTSTGGALGVKSATRDVYFNLILTETSLTGSSTETHTTGVTYGYTVKEGRLKDSTFDYLTNGITGTPVIAGTSSITLKSTNTSGIFPYRLINDTTVKVTDDQGASYKTLSNQTITIPSADVVDANVVDTITFIPLSEITVNLVNRVPGRDIILAVNVNSQTANPAIGANVFNIPTTGTAILTLTYVTAEYNLGTTPTTTTIDVNNVNNTIATFAISGITYNITMIPLYTATLDLELMNVSNSKLTFTYNNVPYTIIANGANSDDFTINGEQVTQNTYVLTTTLPYDSALPSITPSYFPDKNLTTTGFSSLSWSGVTDNLVDGDETLTFSLGYFLTIGNNSTIFLYKHTEFKTIFNADNEELRNLTITTAPSELATPTFIKDNIYYLLSNLDINLDIPNFYGIISNSSITLTAETLYALTTATSGALTDVNFKLESTGTLNHFDYYEIMKDVGTFKTPLYSDDNYSVGATYISTESTPTVTGTPTGNIFYNIVITGGVTVTVTIPNGTQNYTSGMLGTPTGTLPDGTYTIPGNKLGGQYLINDLTFTYDDDDDDSYSNVSGSAVRLYSNVECSSVDLFVNVATPIGGTYADSTITYVSGDFTGAFTIDGSKLGGGVNLTGASIDNTTKAITGTYAGTKPQYFTNVPAQVEDDDDNFVTTSDTFDVKWIANNDIIITLNTNTDNYSGSNGQKYKLQNFDGVNNLDFTLKGISPVQSGTISSGQTLTFTPTYNIRGSNAYTAVKAVLSVNTATPITKTVTIGTDTYTINSLQLLQGATRILSITSLKHLFDDYSLSQTFTTPTVDKTANLIARFETVTFTFSPPQVITSITLSNVKRTGGADGQVVNQTDFSIDLVGATADTYDYTATLGNGLVKSLINQTAVELTLTLTLSKLTLTSTSPSTLSANTLNITGGSNSTTVGSGDTYVFQNTDYTLKGTYTNNAIAMLYDYSATPIQVVTGDITVTIPVYTFTLNFVANAITANTTITLTLEVYNGETDGVPTYNVYLNKLIVNSPSATNYTFSNIPVGCKYKLNRTSDSQTLNEQTLSYEIVVNPHTNPPTTITYTATANNTDNYFTDGTGDTEFIMTGNINVNVNVS
jgi:hypothetical protein